MTQQVDFYNAFIQATIAEEVYVDLPVMISDDNNDYGKYGVVLKLISLYMDSSKRHAPGINTFTKIWKPSISSYPNWIFECIANMK